MKVNKLLMAWFQKEITIAAKKRGCHLIQDELLAKVPEIKSFKVGIVHVFSRFYKTDHNVTSFRGFILWPIFFYPYP